MASLPNRHIQTYDEPACSPPNVFRHRQENRDLTANNSRKACGTLATVVTQRHESNLANQHEALASALNIDTWTCRWRFELVLKPLLKTKKAASYEDAAQRKDHMRWCYFVSSTRSIDCSCCRRGRIMSDEASSARVRSGPASVRSLSIGSVLKGYFKSRPGTVPRASSTWV